MVPCAGQALIIHVEHDKLPEGQQFVSEGQRHGKNVFKYDHALKGQNLIHIDHDSALTGRHGFWGDIFQGVALR
jgi:hypothetical protein